MGMDRPKAFGPVRVIVGFQRSEAQTLHQVGRRLPPHREAQALSREAVIAAADARSRPLDAHLFIKRPGEECAPLGENGADLILRHVMASDDEETDLLTSTLHRGDDLFACSGVTMYEWRDVDDRHRGVRVGDAIAIRYKIVTRLVRHLAPRAHRDAHQDPGVLVNARNFVY